MDERLLKNFTVHKVHIASNGTVSIEDGNKDHVLLSVGKLKPEKDDDLYFTKVELFSRDLPTPYELIFVSNLFIYFFIQELVEKEKCRIRCGRNFRARERNCWTWIFI